MKICVFCRRHILDAILTLGSLPSEHGNEQEQEEQGGGTAGVRRKNEEILSPNDLAIGHLNLVIVVFAGRTNQSKKKVS